MAKKQKQPTKKCQNCVHEFACRMWTDGRLISDATASQCQNHETVKESAAYLCGVLDERKRKKTNADRIRDMSDEELAAFLINFFVENMDINGILHEEVTEADKMELLRLLQQPEEEE